MRGRLFSPLFKCGQNAGRLADGEVRQGMSKGVFLLQALRAGKGVAQWPQGQLSFAWIPSLEADHCALHACRPLSAWHVGNCCCSSLACPTGPREQRQATRSKIKCNKPVRGSCDKSAALARWFPACQCQQGFSTWPLAHLHFWACCCSQSPQLQCSPSHQGPAAHHKHWPQSYWQAPRSCAPLRLAQRCRRPTAQTALWLQSPERLHIPSPLTAAQQLPLPLPCCNHPCHPVVLNMVSPRSNQQKKPTP